MLGACPVAALAPTGVSECHFRPSVRGAETIANPRLTITNITRIPATTYSHPVLSAFCMHARFQTRDAPSLAAVLLRPALHHHGFFTVWNRM